MEDVNLRNAKHHDKVMSSSSHAIIKNGKHESNQPNTTIQPNTTTMKPTTTIATSNNDNNHRTNFVTTLKIHGGIENVNVVEKCDDLVLNNVISMFYEQHV